MCAMGLRWSKTGDMITALRRRLPPVLYHLKHSSAIAEFYHPGYSNVCTMKSNCFAGSKDQVGVCVCVCVYVSVTACVTR